MNAQRSSPACVAHAEVHPERRGHADRRRAADDEPADRVPHLPLVGDLDVDRLGRQLRLVEQADAVAGPGDRLEHGRGLYQKCIGIVTMISTIRNTMNCDAKIVPTG